MSRKFIGAILAATLTLTSVGAQPAQAGNLREDDIAKLLAGAATIFIIGKAIQSSNDHKKKKKQAQHQQAHQKQQSQRQHVHKQHRQNLPRVVQPNRDLPRVVRKKPAYAPPPLPARCLREVTGARTKYVMGAHCLNKRYQSARALPRKCQMQFIGNGRVNVGYSVRCLRKKGYRVQGWR